MRVSFGGRNLVQEATRGCSVDRRLSLLGSPQTDHELASEAQQAVNKNLGAQGVFSLMESVVSQEIACGHVSVSDAPGRGAVDRDFVYQDRRLIMDDDPDFDRAAMECDVAAGGGNASDASNISDN